MVKDWTADPCMHKDLLQRSADCCLPGNRRVKYVLCSAKAPVYRGYIPGCNSLGAEVCTEV